MTSGSLTPSPSPADPPTLRGRRRLIDSPEKGIEPATMRAALLTIAVLLLAATAEAADPEPVLPPAAPAGLGQPVFVLAGGGYGHGVGLNQYGALAQAQAGRSYRTILAFYYRDTEIVRAQRAKVRVLVASGRRSVSIDAAGKLRVRGAVGKTHVLPAGHLVLGPRLRINVGGVATKLEAPVSVMPPAGAPLALDGKRYRGELRVTVDKSGLQVVDHVDLDSYLRGVVPGEMPHEWALEALKAQAVAARSYALASRVQKQAWDLYADTRSQVYYGVDAERPSTTRAVQETHGEVVAFGGKVATTFYYSSSGGRTAASADVFGIPLQYLRSRPDPWDDISPYHRWEPRRFTGRQLADAFGLGSPVADVASEPTPSGRPARVTLVTAGGAVTYDGAGVRERLGLRSAAFRLGVMRLSRTPVAALAGAPTTLTGLARDIDEPALERLAAGTWRRVARPVVRENGSFALTVRPLETTRYRLSAGPVIGPTLTVTVAKAAPPS
jgi:SpoIID/LytB domain protein